MIYSQIWRYPIFRQILRETTLRSRWVQTVQRRSAVTSASHAILNMSTSLENVEFSSCHVHVWSFSEGNHGKPIQEKNWLLELLPAGSWWAPRQGYNWSRKTWWIFVVQNLPQIFHKTSRDTFCFCLCFFCFLFLWVFPFPQYAFTWQGDTAMCNVPTCDAQFRTAEPTAALYKKLATKWCTLW